MICTLVSVEVLQKKESGDSDMLEYFMEFGGMHFVCSLKESVTTFI